VIEQVLDVARTGERFLVACHRRPDADSLGSALGLIKTLRAIGKEATLFMPEEIPDSLLFLMEGEQGLAEVPDGVRYDATWVMDIAAKALLPPGFPSSEVTGPVVIIDHHHAHDDVGDIVYRDTDSALSQRHSVSRHSNRTGGDPTQRRGDRIGWVRLCFRRKYVS